MKADMRGAQMVAPRQPQPPAVQAPRWEYITKVMALGADLAEYGADGWELVAVLPIAYDPSNAVFHFKRRKP